MQRFMVLAALAAVGFAAPSHAAQRYEYVVSGAVRGEQAVYTPGQFGCDQRSGTPQCYSNGPFQATLNETLVNVFSDDGQGRFDFGNERLSGGWSGSIVGGFVRGQPQFGGVDLRYARSVAGCCYFAFASAPSFYARLLSIDGVPVVPEPATWATMTFGFGAVGGAMRKRSRAKTRMDAAAG